MAAGFIWILTILTTVLCAMYVSLIGGYAYGWLRTRAPGFVTDKKTRIAVIVVARNEEQTIRNCLESIRLQSYPADLFEVIVVDDSSEDKTVDIIHSFPETFPNVRLIELKGTGKRGKKAAIAKAIASTKAELIITTDADCMVGKDWISSIASYYQVSGAVMIAGPVSFRRADTIFKEFQSLEFLSLMGSTAGSLYFNKAIMCNGANLAYSKKAFEEVSGFSGIDAKATGDDVLLMYKMNERYKNGVKFLKDRNTIVQTEAKESLRSFIQQRKRWASKGFGAFNSETKMVSLLVFAINLFLLLDLAITGFCSIKSGIYLPFFQISLILLGFKCIIDFLLLFLAATFFNKKKHLYLFLPGQLLYMIYVVTISFLGNKGSYEWKGRHLN